MPTPPLEEPTTKVTLNLWASDIAWFRKTYGQGWSSMLREAVRKIVKEYSRAK